MFCNNCGGFIPDNSSFCPNCGSVADMGGGYGTRTKSSVNLVKAVSLFFTRYVDFKGRSRRSEYWWATLFCNLMSSILTAMLAELGYVWSLITFLPMISVSVRRLHDTGRSGWWYLINLIPLVGSIIFIVFCCQDSSRSRNQWGRSPKYV